MVVAFGGDGTVNEAANGLLGSHTPLCCLPGGSANVFGSMLGIPGESSTPPSTCSRMADDWRPRRVDLGVVNGRCFTFASGLGLDASVVERVDAHPRLKARLGALLLHLGRRDDLPRRYLVNPPRLAVAAAATAGGRHCGRPERLAVHVLPEPPDRDRRGRALDSGALAGGCCIARPRSHAVRSPGARSRAARRVTGHRQVTGLEARRAVVRSADERPLPLQVDGDYLGEVAEARYSIMPSALNVVA